MESATVSQKPQSYQQLKKAQKRRKAQREKEWNDHGWIESIAQRSAPRDGATGIIDEIEKEYCATGSISPSKLSEVSIIISMYQTRLKLCGSIAAPWLKRYEEWIKDPRTRGVITGNARYLIDQEFEDFAGISYNKAIPMKERDRYAIMKEGDAYIAQEWNWIIACLQAEHTTNKQGARHDQRKRTS